MTRDEELPSYVAIPPGGWHEVLCTPSETVAFPLSEEDRRILTILERKFDSEKNISGLAASQIGFSKRMIVFAAPYSEEIKKWRPDFTDSMPKTIWINPSYTPINASETHDDYEGCFSVTNCAGFVSRYKKIAYQAFLPTGERVEGEANGFLARVMQHEIDHTNGILFSKDLSQDRLFSLEEYREKRRKILGDK